MFGADYLLGYSQGRSSAEDERDTNAIIARVIYGQRPVTVDQSYIDRLHAALGACPRMVVVESEVGCLLVVGMEFSLTVRRRRA